MSCQNCGHRKGDHILSEIDGILVHVCTGDRECPCSGYASAQADDLTDDQLIELERGHPTPATAKQAAAELRRRRG